MSSLNRAEALTRDEAMARSALLTVQHVLVELDLRSDDAFRSTTTIEFSARRPGATTFADFRPSGFVHGELNGARLDPSEMEGPTPVEGRIPVVVAERNRLVLSGQMSYSQDGEGLHRHVDPQDGRTYLYAMSFLDAAPRWFACFDQPDLKSRYSFKVTAPEDWIILGNAPFHQTAPGEWASGTTPPLASYFVTLVAGPYASAYDSYDGIRLGIHARQSLAKELDAESADIFEVTKRAFDACHARFGQRYAFGDYQQAFVPDFNAGAMENPGCVTFRDQYLFRGRATTTDRGRRAGTIAHELAHQWFGDLVTMRWWDDLWLNESFAEYMGHEICTEHTRYPLWVDFGMQRKRWGISADLGSLTHPVAGNGAADTVAALAQFDGISYAKGAAVLRQLVALVGREVFDAGLRIYFERHRFGNAEFADFLAALEEAGSPPLADWAAAWLQTAGMDTLVVHQEAGAPAQIVRQPGGDPADRVHSVTVAGLDSAGGETGRSTVAVGDTPVELPVAGALLVPDAGDDSWAGIRPSGPPTDWPDLSAVADVSLRVTLWNSLWSQVQSAEVAPVEALDMVGAQVEHEPNDTIVGTLLDWSRSTLAGAFSPATLREDRLTWTADAARRVMEGADDGSDRQLLGWIALMRMTNDEARLRDWLAGRRLPQGQALDAELRWLIVERLAALTGDRGLVEAAYSADQSTSGRDHRARALASLPDAQAKAEAFELLMRPNELSATELYAVAEGFFHPRQGALTEPFVPRYFAEINGTRAFRQSWALSRVALLAYPSAVSTPKTLELAESTLQDPGLDPAIRRSLLEGTDHLRRAVDSIVRYHGPVARATAPRVTNWDGPPARGG